ncbi:MAG: hypothetical protein ACLFPX_01750 [Candidatus Omnitrophota bacterium]
MKKLSVLTILLVLFLFSVPAQCDSTKLQVTVEIPKLLGLNYFPEEADLSAENTEQSKLQLIEEKAVRDGEFVLVKTRLMK